MATELKDVLKRYRQIKVEAAASATAYSKRLATIEDWLRIQLAASGSDTLKTSEGMVIQYNRRSVKLTGIGEFKEWCTEHAVDGLKESVDSKVMIEWFDMNKDSEPPPGIALDVSLVLAVRGAAD